MTDQIAVGEITLGDEFSQHRIYGFVPHAQLRGMDPKLDVALISHVDGNLWQGGCMDRVELPAGFKHVFSLYPWEQYTLPEGCERVEVKMYDSLDQDTDQVSDLADQIIEALKDGPTLVHCQAGLNRSGLLAATVLVKQGHTPEDAIALLRKSRCNLVLCNESFEDHILGLVA